MTQAAIAIHAGFLIGLFGAAALVLAG